MAIMPIAVTFKGDKVARCSFILSEQLNRAVMELGFDYRRGFKSENIFNYPDVILHLCKKLCKIYVGDIKQTLGLECDDIEVFEKLRDKFSNDASFTTHLEKFVDFARVLLQSSSEDLEINNPLLESDGATWFRDGYNAMLGVHSFISELNQN